MDLIPQIYQINYFQWKADLTGDSGDSTKFIIEFGFYLTISQISNHGYSIDPLVVKKCSSVRDK